MSALTSPTVQRRPHGDPVYCTCGEILYTPRERRQDKCFECERDDERMVCVVCDEYVGMAYCDGRPTFCSDSCEDAYWSCAID